MSNSINQVFHKQVMTASGGLQWCSYRINNHGDVQLVKKVVHPLKGYTLYVPVGSQSSSTSTKKQASVAPLQVVKGGSARAGIFSDISRSLSRTRGRKGGFLRIL